MKKLVCMLLALSAGTIGFTQEMLVLDEQPAFITAAADLGLYSAYVWRGQVVNDGFVAQPSVDLSKGGFGLNVWGNYNLDADADNEDGNFSEVDFALSYTIPDQSDDFDIDVGLIHYIFPDSDADATTELYISSIFNTIILTPELSLFYDIDEAQGFYGSLALSYDYELSDALSVGAGGSVGYGTKKYNETYFSTDKNNMNDYNLYAAADYALTEKLSVGALLQVTLLDSGVEEGAAEDDQVWGGFNLSYEF